MSVSTALWWSQGVLHAGTNSWDYTHHSLSLPQRMASQWASRAESVRECRPVTCLSRLVASAAIYDAVHSCDCSSRALADCQHKAHSHVTTPTPTAIPPAPRATPWPLYSLRFIFYL